MTAATLRKPSSSTRDNIQARVQAIDWNKTAASLDGTGCARFEQLLTPDECGEIAEPLRRRQPFPQPVVMARHGFGRGEYKYFAYPLPDARRGAARRRSTRGSRRSPTAGTTRWASRCAIPPSHADFLARCHAAGQTRPTPLLLQYGAGDYNCLHQDLYGEHVFPLQVAVLLSEPGRGLHRRRVRADRAAPAHAVAAEVVPLRQGDAVVFAVHHRPVQGTRGTYRVNMRHGVSRVRSGHRHTLGIIFHDATVSRAAIDDDLFEPRDATSRSRPARCCCAASRAPADARCCSRRCERCIAAAPFRHMVTPGGSRMSVAMTNCGALGWVTDRRGYRYDADRSR